MHCARARASDSFSAVMNDSYSLITSLVTGFGLALPFGYCFERFLRTPALVGYICAGLAVGFIPGLPELDVDMLEQLAEIGVMLLMFGVGLHFSVQNLFSVKGVAVPGAALQMLLATTLGGLFAAFVWHWSVGQAVMFGLTISCASTVVVTKALEIRRLTTSMNGQVAIGWLVVQDLVSVLFLVLLPPFAQMIHGTADVSVSAVALDVVKTLAGVALFVFLMLVVGRKLIPWVLKEVAGTGSRELFTLTVLGSAIVIAYGAGAIFHVSFALGAFFAGMVMQESRYAHRAAKNSLPLQDAFSVLFFVSVGLMLDWHIFIERPLDVAAVVLVIMGATTSVSFALVVLLKWPLKTALTVAACLGQIGEFSYILAQQGIALGLADAGMMSLIVAASIVTIALNPILFALIPRVNHALVARFPWARRAAVRQTPGEALPQETPIEFLRGQMIVIGAGDETHELLKSLRAIEHPTIIIADAGENTDALIEAGFRVIVGDAADPMVLVQAHVTRASVLVYSRTDALRAKRVYDAARELNPLLRIIIRVPTPEDGAVFGTEDPNLDIICDAFVTELALSAEAMRSLLKPKAGATRADARAGDPDDEEDDDDAAPKKPSAEEQLRRHWEAEYEQGVRDIRSGAFPKREKFDGKNPFKPEPASAEPVEAPDLKESETAGRAAGETVKALKRRIRAKTLVAWRRLKPGSKKRGDSDAARPKNEDESKSETDE